jgi:hypothetical protein
MLGLPATAQTRAFIVIFDNEYTLPVASACGALMEMCFMLSVSRQEELQLVRIAGDERQCANGYLL